MTALLHDHFCTALLGTKKRCAFTASAMETLHGTMGKKEKMCFHGLGHGNSQAQGRAITLIARPCACASRRDGDWLPGSPNLEAGHGIRTTRSTPLRGATCTMLPSPLVTNFVFQFCSKVSRRHHASWTGKKQVEGVNGALAYRNALSYACAVATPRHAIAVFTKWHSKRSTPHRRYVEPTAPCNT